MLLCLAWAWLGVAVADEPPDDTAWIGRPIASVTLSAPRGGLPEESLEPLLRAQQGALATPGVLRNDLATLFRVGEFAAVEAEIEPWFVMDASGNQVPAVLVTYTVLPPPRVTRVRVQGGDELSTRTLLAAAEITTGQPFYPDLDGPIVADRVQRAMVARGYPNAIAEADPVEIAPNEYELWLRVFEGRAERIAGVSFVGELPTPLTRRDHRTLRRWARRAGVSPGAALNRGDVQRSGDALRAKLARVDGGLLGRSWGYTDARVTPTIQINDDDEATVVFPIETGPRLSLEVSGLRWRKRRTVKAALDIDERLRITRGWLEDAPARLDAALSRHGYTDATSEVTLSSDGDTRTLSVDVTRGQRYLLQRLGRRFTFVGNEHADAATLTAVFDQASPSITRVGIYSPAEIERGLRAAAGMYAGRGYPDATLKVASVNTRPTKWWPIRTAQNVWARLTGASVPLRATPTITVNEGALVRQSEVVVDGLPEGFNDEDLAERVAERANEPFSALAVDQLARSYVDQLRATGHLQADTRVRHVPDEDGRVRSRIDITAGPVVLLRSVVTRGARQTRPEFIRRQVNLTLGQTLTTSTLEQTRRQLYDLAAFRTVSTELLGDEAARDLLIAVTERPRWAFEIGGGLSTDQGLRTFGRATRRNLFGLAHRLDIYGLVALDYRSDAIGDWQPDWRTPEFRAAVSYTAPHFPTRQQDLVLDVLLRERRQERTWRMARSGLGALIDSRLGRATQIQVSGRVERRELQEIDSGALLIGEAWEVIRRTPSERDPWRTQEQLELVVLHDRRDDPVKPTRGALVSLRSQLVPGIPWSDQEVRPASSFAKTELRVVGTAPLGGPSLRLSLQAGLSRSLDGSPVPLEDRFRLGGTGSLRGFPRQSIGPRNIAPRTDIAWPQALRPVAELALRDDPLRWVPTGGDAVVFGVTELNVPLTSIGLASWDGWSAALFADVGNTWLLDPNTQVSTNQEPWRALVPSLRVGTGAGVRVDTPVGPLQLDAALNPQRIFARGPTRTLLVTDWEEPAWRIHLALGTLW